MTDVQSIKVYVGRRPSRPYWFMFYSDPISEKRVIRSTKQRLKKDAQKMAGVWERELNAGIYEQKSRMSWVDFRERYTDRHLANLRTKSELASHTALNWLEREIDPARIGSVTTSVMATFIDRLRKRGMKPTTINSHLRRLRAAFGWAEQQGIINTVPKFKMLPAGKGKKMRNRPITETEFQKMLEACKAIRPHDYERWQRLLTGLWFLGIRISEALALSWDSDAGFGIDLGGLYPAFRIFGEAQKNGQDQICPIAPDGAEFLLQTPQNQRRGFVFDLSGPNTAPGENLSDKRVVRIISNIGQAAGVVVDERSGKCATSHDFRRAFASRWARKGISTLILAQMMRHSSASTTESYYVDITSDDISATLHQFVAENPISDTIGDTSPKSVPAGGGAC